MGKTLDIEFIFVIPRDKIDESVEAAKLEGAEIPDDLDRVIAGDLLASLLKEYSYEVEDGMQIHLLGITEGVILDEEQ